MSTIPFGGPGAIPPDASPERGNTASGRFENVIREYGVVNACEWFGHAPDSEFTKDSIRVLMERSSGTVECETCGGDGQETCTNPDHGFINMLSFHDIGRLGCPSCGHDPKHKVPNGGSCEDCNGIGYLLRARGEA